MKDIKQLRDEVKTHLNNKTVAEILSYIGYEITRDYRFQDNKSFYIFKNGYIKDFGGTKFAGDIFDFIIKEKNIKFPQALKFVADCLGVDYE